MSQPAAVTPSQPWLHPALEVRDSAIEGRGLFAVTALDAGVVVMRLGGSLVDDAELARLIAAADADPHSPYVDTVTVGENRHLVLPSGSATHYGNHSCEPNLWMLHALTIATRRRIDAGEELTAPRPSAAVRRPLDGRPWLPGSLPRDQRARGLRRTRSPSVPTR